MVVSSLPLTVFSTWSWIGWNSSMLGGGLLAFGGCGDGTDLEVLVS